MAATSLAYEVDKYSLAQSFYVNEENGIFITKIELFFQDIGAVNVLPVQLEMRPMVNGFPSSSTIIPGTEVTVAGPDIKVSTGTVLTKTPTNFEFDEPIFLNGLTDYCFVVATNTSKYKLFAAQGDTFVLGSTEERISKQQTNGSLFFSQNAATFTAAQDTDLSFKIIRAAFKHQTATVTLKNTTLPQKLLTNNPLTTTSGSSVITVYHPNHGFQPNDFINIHMGGGTIAGLDSDDITGYHRILSSDSDVDYTGFKIDVGSNANSTATGGGNSVVCDKNMMYSVIHPNVEILEPNGTIYSSGMKATETLNFDNSNYGSTTSSQKYSKEAEYTFLALNTDNESETPLVILSSSNNDSAGISDGSASIQISLVSNDSNVSPMIDLQRTSITTIGYQIDKQAETVTEGFNVPISYVSESNPTGGSSASKHITTPITLAEDAVGLKILLAANRPSDTDFQVWFRTSTTDEVITDKTWTLQDEETNNPIDNDPEVFRDYEYLPGGEGGTLTPFTKFQIKIVMRSSSFAKAPSFQSMRVIALSV